MKERFTFCWLTNFACNYRCPYCYFNKQWEAVFKRDKYFAKEQVLSTWQNIYHKYGEVHIEISGGEPTLYPDFVDIIKQISKIHSISISTNLSIDVHEIIENIDSKRITFGVSFHPPFAEVSDMLDKLYLLKQNHYPVWVVCVAWPPIIHDLDYYFSVFQEYNFKVLPFWGKYNDLNYPQDYAAEEKKIINRYIAIREQVKFSTEPPRVSGRLCKAGQVYAHIMPDGEVMRCGNSMEPMNKNFFDSGFSLSDNPLPCKSEYCGCLERVVCDA